MTVETAGYALAAAAYAFLTVLLVASYRERMKARLLAAASLLTAAWAAAYVFLPAGLFIGGLGVFVLEFVVDAAWLLFLAGLMGGGVGGAQFRLLRIAGLLTVAGLLVAGFVLEYLAMIGRLAAGAGSVLVLGQVLTSLFLLVYSEQIIRNARDRQRPSLKYLCLGLAAMAAFDLVLYSYAMVDGHISPDLWAARGYVAALCVPLLVVAVHRAPAWSGGIFVSRQVVFHTATVFGAGLYLTIAGIAGQLIRSFGGDWGLVAQVVFTAAAIIGFAVLLFSGRVRSWLRVWISKHFYRNKYDYREEWLRLTETMTDDAEALPLQKRAIKALADIVGAPSGYLWLRSPDTDEYGTRANWNVGKLDLSLAADAGLPSFLARDGWIVDLDELAERPSLYGDRPLARDLAGIGNARFVVPLISGASLLGFVVLLDPPVPVRLNYEDRDLLKAAGKQIASYIAQDAATEALAQGRQFEAFNKLTAYLMHDLKNVIAQQALLVENAEKHRAKPEFVDDAIETVRAGVRRMRRVMEHLRQGSVQHGVENVELGTVVMKAVSECATRDPAPRAHIGDGRRWVRANRERLQMAIYHAIRNAQDACSPGDTVTVEITDRDGGYAIRIIDTGAGMDAEFVRNRLFRPFDSTKGTGGMGIGAYQIRETVRQAGGQVEVESEPGAGTTVTLYLPIEA